MSKRALRMERRHEKAGPAHLNIVSLMDIFTLLVFFLLANSNDVEVLPSASIIQMPESVSEQKPRADRRRHGHRRRHPRARRVGRDDEGRDRGQRAGDRAAQGGARRRGVAPHRDRRRRARGARGDDHGRQGDSLPSAEEGDGDVHGRRLRAHLARRHAEGEQGERARGRAAHEQGRRSLPQLRAAVDDHAGGGCAPQAHLQARPRRARRARDPHALPAGARDRYAAKRRRCRSASRGSSRSARRRRPS